MSHLCRVGVGVEEIEDVGVVGWEAVLERMAFGFCDEMMGGVMVVEI